MTPKLLATWLEFLELTDCPCEWGYGPQGSLYGVSFGKGWSRSTTEPTCPHHGTEHPAPVEPG